MQTKKDYYYISDDLAKELLDNGLCANACSPIVTRVKMSYVYYLGNYISTLYTVPTQDDNEDDLVRQLVLLPTKEARVIYLEAS